MVGTTPIANEKMWLYGYTENARIEALKRITYLLREADWKRDFQLSTLNNTKQKLQNLLNYINGNNS